MSTSTPGAQTPTQPLRVPPPTKHQLALMIWLAVFPTLTLLNLAWVTPWRRCTRCSARWCSPRSPSRSSSTASCRTCTAPALPW